LRFLARFSPENEGKFGDQKKKKKKKKVREETFLL
jgi:hypothetical protein